jgi:ABC-type Fe3+ transport system substrate-binding protein
LYSLEFAVQSGVARPYRVLTAVTFAAGCGVPVCCNRVRQRGYPQPHACVIATMLAQELFGLLRVRGRSRCWGAPARAGARQFATWLFALGLSAATTNASARADSAQWEALIAAAKKEGSVRVSLPIGLPSLGALLAAPFERRFGIKLSYSNDNTSVHMKIQQEAAAGKLTVDVITSGAGELLSLYPQKLLAPVRPILVDPTVIDGSKWQGGELKWIDNAKQFMPMTSEWVHIDLAVNANFVKPADITSWKDLLDPKYKGKIISLAVTVGAGGATARALLEDFGPDYLRDLYQGQSVKITRNARDLVRTLATGSQPIALALLPQHLEDFRKQGFKLVRVFPTDGRLSTSGGSANPKLLANAPHPNAAAVFINWFMSKEGQEIYAANSLESSRRIDVKAEEIPDYIIPKHGIDYRNQYQEDYHIRAAAEMRTRIEQLLGR